MERVNKITYNNETVELPPSVQVDESIGDCYRIVFEVVKKMAERINELETESLDE